MEGLPVSYSLNSGDNGNNWWGDFIGAAIGGAAGAAWGRGKIITGAAGMAVAVAATTTTSSSWTR